MNLKQTFFFLGVYLSSIALCYGADGFTSLFDGKSLDGWKPLPGGKWEIVDGAIVGSQNQAEKRHGQLLSEKQHDDFVVRLKFKALEGNSGFYFRVQQVDQAVAVKGFQAEISADGSEIGGLYETLGRAWVVQPTPEFVKTYYKAKQWNKMTVTAVGGDITVEVNGVKTAELKDDPGARRGFFGLQLHGGQKMHVAFKDIEIKEIGGAVGESGTKEQTRLSGARPVIDAVEYPTLQAALDALPAEGGVVRLPPGTFEIEKPLILSKGDVLLEGAGAASHIKNVNQTGEPALVIESGRPSAAQKDKQESVWRVMLSKFRLTGNEKSGHGIVARFVDEIHVDAVTVSYHGGDGIHLHQCYEDPRISDCLITYNKGTGLHLFGCHDIVVSANHFEENLDALQCLDGYNLCMNGNNLDDHLRDGVVIENTYGSVVSGNMIEECQGTGVILDRNCYGITLSANVIAHNTSGGIDLRDAHGCAVSANTFTIVPKGALTIGPNSGRITVTGNNFSGSYIGEGTEWRRPDDQAASGIVLRGTSDVTISGNIFSGLSTKALQLDEPPSRRILFSNNVLTDVQSDHGRLQQSHVGDNILPASQ